MNEQERHANRGLRALDEAHRTGRISREEYRARRRTLLIALCDSDGVTARNALMPSAAAHPGDPGARRVAGPAGDVVGALFPDRRRLGRKLWLMVMVGFGLCVLLYGAVRLGRG